MLVGVSRQNDHQIHRFTSHSSHSKHPLHPSVVKHCSQGVSFKLSLFPTASHTQFVYTLQTDIVGIIDGSLIEPAHIQVAYTLQMKKDGVRDDSLSASHHVQGVTPFISRNAASTIVT